MGFYFFLIYKNFFKFIYFETEREHGGGAERGGESESQAGSTQAEPDVGLKLNKLRNHDLS